MIDYFSGVVFQGFFLSRIAEAAERWAEVFIGFVGTVRDMFFQFAVTDELDCCTENSESPCPSSDRPKTMAAWSISPKLIFFSGPE